MSIENQSRFKEMRASKSILYYIQFSLADETYSVENSLVCGFSYKNSNNSSHFEEAYCQDSHETPPLTTFTDTQKLQIDFNVRVYAMKRNPLLKIETITPEQYKTQNKYSKIIKVK